MDAGPLPPEATTSSRRVALITGASRGIGATIADRFARAGWDMTISARSQGALDERAATLRADHGACVEVQPADAIDDESLMDLVDAHSATFQRLDALIINAGLGQSGSIADFPARRFDRMFQVNVRAGYVMLQHALPLLRSTAEAHGTAKVLALASITGVYAEPFLSAYGATKAALISLCESLNVEESESGVSATAIAPGFVDTDMSDWTKARIPAAQMIRPDDVATVALAVTELSRHAVLPSVVLTRPGQSLWRA